MQDDPKEIVRKIKAIRARVPNATDEEILSFLEEEAGPVKPSEYPLNIKNVGGMAATAAQGLPLVGTFTDELAGSLYGALSPSKTMQQGRDAVRGLIQQTRAAHPRASLAAEVGAGMAGGYGLLKGAPLLAQKVGLGIVNRSAPLLERMKQGLKGGAILGATAGAGAGEGGIQDRLPETLVGTGLGAGVGGLAPVIGAAGRWVGRKGADLTHKVRDLANNALDMNPRRLAVEGLAKAVDSDVLDLEDLARHANPDDQLVDILGPNARSTTQAAASVPSKEATLFNRMLTQREIPSGSTKTSFVKATGVDPAQGNATAKQEIFDIIKPDVQKAYQQVASEHPFLRDPRLQAFLGKDTPVIRKAKARAAERFFNNQKKPLPITSEGEYRFESFEALDELKKALDEIGQATPKKPAKGSSARVAARELKELMDEFVERRAVVQGSDPGVYRTARETAQQIPIFQKATDLGAKLAKTGDVRDAETLFAQTVKNAPAEMHEPARVAMREGAARALTASLSKASTEADAITKLLGTERAEQVARLAFPDERSFDAFASDARRHLIRLLQQAAASGNPKAVQIAQSLDVLGDMTPWALAQFFKGNGALALAQGMGGMQKKIVEQMNQRAAPELLKLAQLPVRGGADPLTGAGIPSAELRALLAEFSKAKKGPRMPSAPSTRNTLLRRGVAQTTLERFLGGRE